MSKTLSIPVGAGFVSEISAIGQARTSGLGR